MNEESVQYLVKKFLKGQCTPAERRMLAQWIDQAASDAALKRMLEDAWKQFQPAEKMPLNKGNAILSFILSQEEVLEQQPSNRPLLWVRRLSVTLILLIAVTVAGYLLISKTENNKSANVITHRAPLLNDAYPGSNAAQLTLSDGTIFMLDSANSKLPFQGNVQLVKQPGELIYKGTERETVPVIFNTLTTKRGQLYPVRLSDGTKIWLNSASSVHFPVAFNGKDRIVSLTGEAYFEVARNPEKPFKVLVNGTEITVLGTHFNVNGYSDETTTQTTLLTGSLRMSNHRLSVLVAPGQRAVSNENGSIDLLKNINAEHSTAWKDGYFHFDNTSLENVMRQLARWYDVDVEYLTTEPAQYFNGDFKNNVKLSEILKILERGQVHSRIENGKVIVTQ